MANVAGGIGARGITQRFGATPAADGVAFRVWAPSQTKVALVLDGGAELPMIRDAEGFFTIHVAGVRAGQRYWYRLAQGLRPDPASRFQPEGPLGPSQVVDASTYRWRDETWRGIEDSHRHVFYEMHIGTFTEEGTWSAAIAHLPGLADLGITTLEVMPLASFTGRFGWGYDGVQLFAPTHLYGSPDDVRRFVDAAHALGLAVILDVVYNHFGPVGNFFPEFSRSILGPPGEWGDAINFDGEGSATVREFMKANAAYWIGDFHFDGLRLDAVHAIHDTSEEHIVSAICRAAREAAPHRAVFIAGECESQDSTLLRSTGAYSDGLDAIWNEDWHHSAFVRLTGRRQAYFTDYRGTAAEFAAMARHGFLYQGQWYSWQKKGRGGYSLGLPGSRFVSFLENHDQVANTGLGARLYHHADASLWRAMTALLLLGPQLPLIFQGAEFASSRPFAYFADHDAELAKAVEKGRADFLAQFPYLATPEMRRAIPRPAAVETFETSKLRDDERKGRMLAFYRDLLHLRREDAVLRDVGTAAVSIDSSAPTESVLLIRYISEPGHRLLIVNLGGDHVSPMNDPLFAPPRGRSWRCLVASDQVKYGGCGVVEFADGGRWLLPAASATLLGA